MKWFSSYLYGRNKCTLFKGKFSDKVSIHKNRCTTILGPLLSIIFINNLQLVTAHSEIYMYADDSTVNLLLKPLKRLMST